MFASQLNQAIAVCEQSLRRGVGFDAACRALGDLLQGVGWFREAVIWHSRALEAKPYAAEIYAGFGALFVKQRDLPRALAAYKQSLRLDATYAEAHRSLAGIYAQMGQRQEELAYRYRAVTLNPQWATPSNQLVLGNALIQIDKPKHAIDCYRRAIRLRPDFYEAYYNLGVAETYQQNWSAAKQAFLRVLQLNPHHAEAHYGLGKLAEQSQDFATAAGHFQRAAELAPDFASAFLSLGEALLQLRQWRRAAVACQRAAELNADLSWAHHNLGYALLKCQRRPQAFAALYRAIKLNPDYPWSYYHLAEVLLQQQQWDKAVAVLLAAIQLQPDLLAMYLRLGYAMRRQAAVGLKVTIRRYQRAVPLKPQNRHSGFYLQMASRLLQFKQYTGAVIFYSLALLQEPENEQLRLQLQQALTEKQRLDQEIAAHRREIQEYPHHHWIYSHLGNLLADQGELEEAIALHQAAIVMRGWQCAAARNYQFTHDWFTHNIATWQVHLQPFAHRPRLQILEIGSFEGMSACWLLDHILTHPLARLTCIDLYFQESFEMNIALTGAAEKVTQLVGDSHQILTTLPSETYDVIYIDGCHLANHVHQDAALSWRLLKVGGLMIFDDYEWIDTSHPGQETHLGIDAFLASMKTQMTVVHQGYQVIVQKLKLPIQQLEKQTKQMYPSTAIRASTLASVS
ncbi:MAG: tetratricopeptide repeat protein [Synechococcales cyanobacterium C42_A2020_086]|jgi:tetratricopeptide (TPR) repeat protein|nr:tetratricopeptide repeat protein [Synechococcales cyanobacterium C42_A2020_086]